MILRVLNLMVIGALILAAVLSLVLVTKHRASDDVTSSDTVGEENAFELAEVLGGTL